MAALELDEDLAFQKVDWRVERISWVLLLVVLMGGVAGVFGRGIYDERRHEWREFTVHISPMARAEASTELRIAAARGKQRIEDLSVSLPLSAEVQRCVPLPVRMETDGQCQWLHFSHDGLQPINLYIDFRPRDIGLAEISLAHTGEQIMLSQWVWP